MSKPINYVVTTRHVITLNDDDPDPYAAGHKAVLASQQEDIILQPVEIFAIGDLVYNTTLRYKTAGDSNTFIKDRTSVHTIVELYGPNQYLIEDIVTGDLDNVAGEHLERAP